MPATDDNAVIRSWLEQAMRTQGLKPTPFAKAAGLAPSTLLRALDPDSPTSLERASITKIARRFNIAPPGAMLTAAPAGFAEDLVAFDDPPATFCGTPLTADQFVRRTGTRALELSGLLPGDLLLFDMAAAPRAGDAVAANLYGHGGAITALRLYEPPYLVTRTMHDDAHAKPLLVEDDRVRIMATMVTSLRTRAP